MFREIRKSEKISDRFETKKNERKGFESIKPETDITIEEAKKFVDNLFKSVEEA